jgi:hypothetical protein
MFGFVQTKISHRSAVISCVFSIRLICQFYILFFCFVLCVYRQVCCVDDDVPRETGKRKQKQTEMRIAAIIQNPKSLLLLPRAKKRLVCVLVLFFLFLRFPFVFHPLHAVSFVISIDPNLSAGRRAVRHTKTLIIIRLRLLYVRPCRAIVAGWSV